MTWIRIDPNEMETASNELQRCADSVGGAVTGLQGQCAGCAMPAAVSAQVSSTLGSVERQLNDIRVELLLEATILAIRGILAIKGSPVAGSLSMEMPAPTTGFVGGTLITAGITSGSSGTATIGGNLITAGITSGSSGTATIGGNLASNGIISGSSGTATIGGAFAGGATATGFNPAGLGTIGGDSGSGVFSSSGIIGSPTSPSTIGNLTILDAMGSGGSPVGRIYNGGQSYGQIANSDSLRSRNGITMKLDPKPFTLDLPEKRE